MIWESGQSGGFNYFSTKQRVQSAEWFFIILHIDLFPVHFPSKQTLYRMKRPLGQPSPVTSELPTAHRVNTEARFYHEDFIFLPLSNSRPPFFPWNREGQVGEATEGIPDVFGYLRSQAGPTPPVKQSLRRSEGWSTTGVLPSWALTHRKRWLHAVYSCGTTCLVIYTRMISV